MSQGRIFVLCSAAVLAVVFCFWLIRDTSIDEEDDRSESRKIQEQRRRLLKKRNLPRMSAREAVSRAMTRTGVKRGDRQKWRSRYSYSPFEDLKGKDRKMAEAVQAAFDDGDFDKVVVASEKSLASDNPEVRLNAVEALGWFGVDALPELTVAVADPDPEVSFAAESAWEQALLEIDDQVQKYAVVTAMFSALDNKDYLITIGGEYANLAQGLIDSTDDPVVAAQYRQEIVQDLVDMIGNSDNAEAAAEVYRDITGNDWVSIEEAELYLRNPDGYEGPEFREEGYDYDYIDPATCMLLYGTEVPPEKKAREAAAEQQEMDQLNEQIQQAQHELDALSKEAADTAPAATEARTDDENQDAENQEEVNQEDQTNE